MKALIDADILRYEIGFAAETGWRAIQSDPDAIPNFEYVRSMLEQRIQYILQSTDAESYELFLTEGPTFREDIAVSRPYKGTRKENKPWHFSNLTAWMIEVMGANVVTTIEADDALTIAHLDSEEPTILCSRDKDLRQVPGWFYSWELGNQPSFGPYKVDQAGHLELDKSRSTPKLTGSGFSFFCAQLLMGDAVDNIPGLPKCGPVAAAAALHDIILEGNPDEDDDLLSRDMLAKVREMYDEKLGIDTDEYLLEQGRLLWMTRSLHEDGSPVLWELDMIK